jgi:hypothetical protein
MSIPCSIARATAVSLLPVLFICDSAIPGFKLTRILKHAER